MSSRSHRLPRVLRGVAGATVATFVALMAHVAAGATPPQAVGILVPWVLSTFVCIALAGRALSLWRVSVAVLLSQACFHTLFVLGAFASAGHSPGHVHGAVALDLSAALAPSVLHPPMAGGHLAAALLTIAIVHRGERAVRRAIALGSAFLRWLVRPARTHVTPSATAPRFLPVAHNEDLRARAPRIRIRRRGPPLSLAV